MEQYHVYLWRHLTSEVPEVVRLLSAATPDLAIQQVMQVARLRTVYYAWVVPVRDDLPTVDRYHVQCPTARVGD